jgi:hypothetical protein
LSEQGAAEASAASDLIGTDTPRAASPVTSAPESESVSQQECHGASMRKRLADHSEICRLCQRICKPRSSRRGRRETGPRPCPRLRRPSRRHLILSPRPSPRPRLRPSHRPSHQLSMGPKDTPNRAFRARMQPTATQASTRLVLKRPSMPSTSKLLSTALKKSDDSAGDVETQTQEPSN